MTALDDRERVEVTTRAGWRDWLARHHGTSPGVWVVRWKKGRGPHLPYEDVVEEALCFGWIDSVQRTVDADRSMLLVTPRKPRSAWSALNKTRVERLLAAGLMAPPGLAVVEAAKASGRWEALDGVETLEEPPDLAAALDADPVARATWDATPRSLRRGVLEYLLTAKREETRARRVAKVAGECAAGNRPLLWTRKEP